MEKKQCSICKTMMHEFIPAGDEQHYYACPACEWIVLDEAHIIPHEQQQERYALHENTCDNEGYVAMFERFMTACVDPYRNTIHTILDFGCGPGPVLATLLKQRGFQVDMYDIFFKPDESYRKKKYDLITMTEVLEHIKDPLSIMRDLTRCLSKKGKIALMTLFHEADEARFAQWWYRREDTHISFYTTKTLHVLAQALNMRVLFSDEKQLSVLGA